LQLFAHFRQGFEHTTRNQRRVCSRIQHERCDRNSIKGGHHRTAIVGLTRCAGIRDSKLANTSPRFTLLA